MPAMGEGATVEDEVWITAMCPDEPMADVVYVGERSVGLNTRFGLNYSFWSVEVDCPLFLPAPYMIAWEEVEAGHGISHSLDLDPDAEPGTYDYTVYFNCSGDEGQVNRTFEFRTTLVEAWRMVDVNVPDGDNYKLSVTFETFVTFDNITVEFGGDGDVGVRDRFFYMEDVQPGKYTMKTRVVEVESTPDNAQEISWDLRGVVDNRTLEKSEYNVNVDVDWVVPGFGAPLVMLAVVVTLALARRRDERV